VAQHKLEEKPAQLFWFDLPTMLNLAGISTAASATAVDDKDDKKLLLATQVQDAQRTTAATSGNSSAFPARPTPAAASEFEISPAVHAGYAFTWYSLSAAGLYMTRKLLTRGRR